VEDHARALRAVFEQGRPGQTYNIGGDADCCNIEVVEALCTVPDRLSPRRRRLSYRDLITFVADRPGHDARYAIEATKIRQELGWAPQQSFETGIEATVIWYLNNSYWWQDIQSRSYRGERFGLKLASA
jgi:dTDP-glucose 4,6-dehydratase